jgi:hypothetical protein
MTPQQIVRELRALGVRDEDVNKICTHLAERLYSSRLQTGHRLFTLDDGQSWLIELAAAAFVGAGPGVIFEDIKVGKGFATRVFARIKELGLRGRGG